MNLQGQRQTATYGTGTLDDLHTTLTAQASAQGFKLTHFQSNAEHELIEHIHTHGPALDFLIINPAAYTHTSIALRDALAAVNVPFIEVHVSNIYAREAFRRQSYFSDLASGVICGLGMRGYEHALQSAMHTLQQQG